MLDSEGLIQDFVQVARLSGFDIEAGDIVHEVLPAPHRPPALPKGKQAVYVFSLAACGGIVLKVGKAGPKSNARFQSQHYKPNRGRSTLARSLLSSKENWTRLGTESMDEETVGSWMKKNLDRDHFYLAANKGDLLLSLLEIFLQCRLDPLF